MYVLIGFGLVLLLLTAFVGLPYRQTWKERRGTSDR